MNHKFDRTLRILSNVKYPESGPGAESISYKGFKSELLQELERIGRLDNTTYWLIKDLPDYLGYPNPGYPMSRHFIAPVEKTLNSLVERIRKTSGFSGAIGLLKIKNTLIPSPLSKGSEAEDVHLQDELEPEEYSQEEAFNDIDDILKQTKIDGGVLVDDLPRELAKLFLKCSINTGRKWQ